MRELKLNGDLQRDLFAGATIEEYYNVGLHWYVLAKSGRDYLQYETDDELLFHHTQTWKFSRPTAVAKFKENVEPKVPELGIRDPEKMWHKKMNRGEWDRIVANNKRLEAIIEANSKL